MGFKALGPYRHAETVPSPPGPKWTTRVQVRYRAVCRKYKTGLSTLALCLAILTVIFGLAGLMVYFANRMHDREEEENALKDCSAFRNWSMQLMPARCIQYWSHPPESNHPCP